MAERALQRRGHLSEVKRTAAKLEAVQTGRGPHEAAHAGATQKLKSARIVR